MGIKLALYKPVDVIYFLLFTPNNNIIKLEKQVSANIANPIHQKILYEDV